MCVIIYKPAGVAIKKETLKSCWDTNPDGAGYVVPQKGKPVMRKGIMTFDDLWVDVEMMESYVAFIHLRIATHGAITPENTHPHYAGRGRWLLHNGMLSNYGKAGAVEGGCSDSAQLASDIKRMETEAIERLLSSINGKFAFVDEDYYWHGAGWEKKDGLTFSNTYWDRRAYSYNSHNANNEYWKNRYNDDEDTYVIGKGKELGLTAWEETKLVEEWIARYKKAKKGLKKTLPVEENSQQLVALPPPPMVQEQATKEEVKVCEQPIAGGDSVEGFDPDTAGVQGPFFDRCGLIN